ncbi:MAG: cob(I)yrinic acid a,c-diamide adenosyltransferase [Gammaproteobacteria bacterium]|nr:cob(I)yrinic acid a,c-diamide adenosyltransferase [Gammaproteobacteria bacterium]
MGHRLSKIYTRTGDKGDTGLADGSRIDKDHIRIEAMGTVDELNSIIGMVLAHKVPEKIHGCFNSIQHHLFDLGGELCIPGHTALNDNYITYLENTLDELNANLPMLKEFILPSGGQATSACHLARTVCRRAERRVVTLAKGEQISPFTIRYLNRLSDLLFVIARVLARHENGSEVLWQPYEM